MGAPIKTNIRILILAALGALFPAMAKANTESAYVEKWIWKAEDTKAKSLVGGRILLRACWDIPSNLAIPGGRTVAYWKDEVETHINSVWNFYSVIRVVFGTADCDFKIGHDDRRKVAGTNVDWAPRSRIGNDAKNISTPAMFLCWTFKNYAPGLVTREVGKVLQYDGDYHRAVILSQATHEFGHILGLLHDQDLPDKPSSCAAKLEPALTGLKPVGLYDPKSIMNYCNDDLRYARQIAPSCGDIGVLRAMYGRNPTNDYEPECYLKCASGLDDNLAKTGAALAGCKPPPDRATGTLNNLPNRILYPDETQYGGNNDGNTVGEYVDIPAQRGLEPLFRVDVTPSPNGTEWILRVEFLNPDRVVFNRARYYKAQLYLPGNANPLVIQGPPLSGYYTPSTFPLTLNYPMGAGTKRLPSGLYFSVNKTQPKKVTVNTYEYVNLYFQYTVAPGIEGTKIIRVNLGYPLPQVFEYFNAMDEKTVVPAKQMVKIPAKTTGNAIAPFLMDQYEVTQRDYMAIMKEFPFDWPGDADAPAEGVTQYDAMLYCNKRSILEGFSPAYSHGRPVFDSAGKCIQLPNLSVDRKKSGYRLPTIGEAIYALMGTTDTDYPWGNIEYPDANAYGWHNRIASRPHPVGQKLPNQWGLFDTFGNVMEWETSHDPACAGGGAYNDWTSTIRYTGYVNREKACIGSASSAPFIGFRPVRKIPDILPILMPFFLKQ